MDGVSPIVTVDECRALTDTDVRDRIRALASSARSRDGRHERSTGALPLRLAGS
ncbi:MAG: hypothetical protein ACLPPF_00350 [Rhodomicrobium sp.]